VPLFLVEGIKRRIGSLSGRKVAVLGLAFKADTDDERDSLAHKLIRLLERELADVVAHDPHVPTPTVPFEEAVENADVVVVAANHSEFREPRALSTIAERAGADCLVIDPWNCWGTGQVFAYVTELSALGPHGGAGSASSVARVRSTPRSLRPSPACPAGPGKPEE